MFRTRSIQPELVEFKIVQSELFAKEFPRIKTGAKATIAILPEKKIVLSTTLTNNVVEKLEGPEFYTSADGNIYQPSDLIQVLAYKYEMEAARLVSTHETLGVRQALYTIGKPSKKETSYAAYKTITHENITLKLYPALLASFDGGPTINLMEIDFKATVKGRVVIEDTLFMVFKNSECKNSDIIESLFTEKKIKADPAQLRNEVVKYVKRFEFQLLQNLHECFRLAELSIGNTPESVILGVMLFQSRHLSGPKPSDKIGYTAIIKQAELFNLIIPHIRNTSFMDYFSVVLND